MINHILLICSSIVIYEFIRYVKFTNFIKSNLKIYKKILKLFKYKNVSDFRKEKLISKSKNTPIEDKKLQGKVLNTFVSGEVLFKSE